MDPAAVSALHYSRPFSHSPRLVKVSQFTGNSIAEAHLLEKELTEYVNRFRRDLDLGTNWDRKLGHILGSALSAYEVSDLYDFVPGNEEFQQAVKRTVPDGHTFKAFPLRLHSRNPRAVFNSLLR